LSIKDLFIQCPKGHWNTITISEKSIGSKSQYFCDKCNKTHEHNVTDKDMERKSKSKVKYWGAE
jgi:hypothetical protein